MTLLTMIQAAANELGLQEPSDVMGSSTSDDTVRQLLALANREGKELSDRHNWTAQQTITTVTTVANQANYALPADFKNFQNDTQWDTTNHWALIGPMTPQEWEMLKNGIITSGPRRRFRQYGHGANQLYIDPTPPEAGNTLTYEYASLNWCQSSSGTGQQQWLADDDTGILDENIMCMGIKWRFLAANRFGYAQEQSDYNDAVRVKVAQDGGAAVLQLAPRRRWPYLIGPANIPEAGFGS